MKINFKLLNHETDVISYYDNGIIKMHFNVNGHDLVITLSAQPKYIYEIMICCDGRFFRCKCIGDIILKDYFMPKSILNLMMELFYLKLENN